MIDNCLAAVVSDEHNQTAALPIAVPYRADEAIVARFADRGCGVLRVLLCGMYGRVDVLPSSCVGQITHVTRFLAEEKEAAVY